MMSKYREGGRWRHTISEKIDIDMKEVEKLHDSAMSYAENALLARREGRLTWAHAMFQAALKLEMKAAKKLKDKNLEPTRSVLYCSAATLATDVGDFTLAQELAEEGLRDSGVSPEIAGELHDVLEKAKAGQRFI